MATAPAKKRLTTALVLLAGGIAIAALYLSGSSGDGPPPAGPAGSTPAKAPAAKPGATPPEPASATAAAAVPASTPESGNTAAQSQQERPEIDVVFALDTTGSMAGLIEGAKRKIWSIANQILSGQPRPDVRIGLVGYRDLGDEYVTRSHPLSVDIEDVYSNLKRFRADGGGDTPEHVNRALAVAIRKMQWRQGQNVLRLIFLVGDAPPHDGREGLYTRHLTSEARKRGIVINTVRCGSDPSTALAWRGIAKATGGQYAGVRQDGAMVASRTPMDARLAELNARLAATALPSGSAADKAAARGRLRVNAAMDVFAQAESAKFKARAGVDSTDLLGKLEKGKKLGELKEAELPEEVASLPPAARSAYVAGVAKKRAELKKEIDAAARDREAYLRAKAPPRREKSFDDAIGEALKEQGKRIQVAY